MTHSDPGVGASQIDLATSNFRGDNVSVLLNRTLPAVRADSLGQDLTSLIVQFNDTDLDSALAETLIQQCSTGVTCYA